MAFPLSPGVTITEDDGTAYVPGVGSATGGYAGHFNWGPINEIMTVTEENELVSRVTKPDANTFIGFFMASNFLSYARNLKLIRAEAAAMKNAVANSTAVLIKNDSDYEQNYSTGANTYGMWAAKYAGDIGNSLKVSLYASGNTQNFTNWVYNRNFDSVPGTSEYVSNVNGANDEMHIVVVDEDGRFSGVANTVLEKFGYLSKASDAKNSDGSSNYYKDVINRRSKYVRWMAHPDSGIGLSNATSWGTTAVGTTFGNADDLTYTVSLTGGVIDTPASGNVITAQALLKNEGAVDVSLLIGGDGNTTVVTDLIQNVAEFRKDCIVLISPEKADVVDNADSEQDDVIAFRNTLPSSSFAAMDSGWKYQYDKYNDVYRWLPLCADIAGLCARTEYERDAWYSPAGYNRGSIKNAYKLAWSPNKTNRDELYRNGVNAVINDEPGEGTILFGDKTLLSKPSAFDRINVRRLFIVLEKAIAKASKYSLFEFNDEFTRAQFVSLVEPFLRDVQGRRGIYDFRVICDESNNTPEVIDRNEFVGDIYIKPAKSINFIQLNFIAVRTGVSFEEIVRSV